MFCTLVLFFAYQDSKPPVVHAQAPGATCVLEAVQQSAGFSLPFSCEDRGRFTAAPLTGGACSAPATGVTLYTRLPDGTCLPLVIVPAPGFVAALPPYVTMPHGGTMTPGQLALLMRSVK